ncbi:MAG: gamma-glutamyl-gamma-aminobutyrate hydrolase family protein [Microbacteriaceae bacterium]|nr:gamma-glutamyl-gamma-aminobutyrate hydrolase family protein [Microbacteriaceae bacterium]
MGAIAAGRVAVVIRHLDIAHLGSFDGLLRERGYQITTIDASDLGPGSIEMIEADLVVVLGGDMGAYQTDEYGYLVDELDLLAKRLEDEKPTLGLCLGAQLMAHALGGRASKGKSVVIGFRDVNLTEAGRDSPLRHFAGVPVMQWHGDSFRLPAGATRLASSAEYSNEAFRLGDYALAVQFHPEITGTMYEEWIAQGAAELARHGIDGAELLEQRDRYAERMERAALAMLGEWLDAL